MVVLWFQCEMSPQLTDVNEYLASQLVIPLGKVVKHLEVGPCKPRVAGL